MRSPRPRKSKRLPEGAKRSGQRRRQHLLELSRSRGPPALLSMRNGGMRQHTRTLEAPLVSLASFWLDAILSSDTTTSMTYDTNLFCMANRDSRPTHNSLLTSVRYPSLFLVSRLANPLRFVCLMLRAAFLNRYPCERRPDQGNRTRHTICPYDTRAGLLSEILVTRIAIRA
jgi:hypothetical protein